MDEKQYRYLGYLEVNKEDIHLGRDHDYLYSGIMTNNGFIEQDDYKIDHDLSLGRNIQDFVEFMEEQNANS